jgi:hypothetical protein
LKKIGIITLTGSTNYGNSLQNYALQETLIKLGFIPQTIKNCQYGFNDRDKKYRFKNIVKHILKYKISKNDAMRFVFLKWEKKHMKFSKKVIVSDSILPEIGLEYDFFVCGSDQIWNPSFNGMSSFYFATFADPLKRVAISASFGVTDLSEETKKLYKEWLVGIPAISVREEQAQCMIKELIGRDVELLCDPIYSFAKHEWEAVEEKPKWKNEDKFIFLYFLGNISEEDNKEINEWARTENVQVYMVGFLENIPSINPSEFLWLINHAENVHTDSFHATAFSLLFHKKVYVYDRFMDDEVWANKMNSRIVTLFNKFGIKVNKDHNKYTYGLIEYDNENIDLVLKSERDKFIDYLKQSLK